LPGPDSVGHPREVTGFAPISSWMGGIRFPSSCRAKPALRPRSRRRSLSCCGPEADGRRGTWSTSRGRQGIDPPKNRSGRSRTNHTAAWNRVRYRRRPTTLTASASSHHHLAKWAIPYSVGPLEKALQIGEFHLGRWVCHIDQQAPVICLPIPSPPGPRDNVFRSCASHTVHPDSAWDSSDPALMAIRPRPSRDARWRSSAAFWPSSLTGIRREAREVLMMTDDAGDLCASKKEKCPILAIQISDGVITKTLLMHCTSIIVPTNAMNIAQCSLLG
jgi:hypothetical protein